MNVSKTQHRSIKPIGFALDELVNSLGLTLRKKEIIDKLNTVIGLDAVKDIKFH